MTKVIVKAQKVAEAYKLYKSLLHEREIDILCRYYGLEGQVRHSLAELGELYQVTRERIRQIKVIALKKIKIQ